jgi:hypothetical protein
LQAEVSKLETDATGAAADLERRTAAVETIQTDPTLLSPARRVTFEFLRRQWEENYGGPSRCARLRGAALLNLAAANPDDGEEVRERIVKHCEGDPKLAHIAASRVHQDTGSAFVRMSQPGCARVTYTVDRDAWSRHAVELRAEAEEATRRAEELEAAGAEARAELDSMLANLIE